MAHRRKVTDDMTIAEQLRDWAINVMGISCVKTDTDLSYICRGEMENVWQHVINNVVPRKDAIMMLGNLDLHRSSKVKLYQTDESSDVREKHRALVSQVNRQKVETVALEQEIKATKQRHLINAQLKQRAASSLHDDRLKAELLRQHQKYVNRLIGVLNKYGDTLQRTVTKYDDIKRKGISEQYFFSQQMTHEEHKTDCQSELQAIHTEILALLNSLLEGCTSVSKSELQSRRSAVVTRLQKLMEAYGPSTIINYLIHGLRQSQEKIQEDTSAIDIVKDVEALRFEFVAANLDDKSSQPSIGEELHRLMEQRQIEHQKRFLETEQMRASSLLPLQTIETVRKKLVQRLSMSFANASDKIPLILDLVDTEMKVKQSAAEVNTLKTVCENLQKEVSSVNQQIRAIQEKHRAINNFKHDVQAKQNQICVLLKQNSEARSKLDTKKVAVLDTITALISTEEALLASGSTALKENLSLEIKQLVGLPLASLAKDPHLSFNDLIKVHGEARKHIEMVQKCVHHYSYQAPEVLLGSIVKMKQEVLFSLLQPSKQQTNSQENKTEEVSNLLPKIASHKNSQADSLTSLLTAGQKQASDGLEKVNRMTVVVDHWFHQPALRLNLD